MHFTANKKLKFSITMFFIVVFSVSFTTFVYAENGTPSSISYHGTLTDTGGNPLGGTGTQYYFKFSFWDSPTGGSKVWPSSSPTSLPLTVKQGSFNVNIGDTDNGYPDILDYNWNSNQKVYLQIEISGSENGVYETLTPRSLVTSAPFSQVSSQVNGVNDSSFGTTTPFLNTLISALSTNINKAVMTIKGAVGQVANLFNITDSNNNSLFTVTADGKVGVGTSTPSEKLSVNGNANFGGNLFVNSSGSSTSKIYVGAASNAPGWGGLWVGSNVSTHTVSNYSFLSDGVSSFFSAPASGNVYFRISNSDKAIITNTGNFGIGTSSPSAKLDVWGNLNVGTSSTPALFVNTATGNIGVGTSTPAYPLDIAGKIGINGNQFIYVPGGNFTGTSFIGNGGSNISYTSGVDGKYNTFNGIGSGSSLTTGSYNTGFGTNALASITTGQYNMAIGVNSLFSNSTGSSNVGIGYNTLYDATGHYNVAIGATAMRYMVSGAGNTAIGYAALPANTSGAYNVVMGYGVGQFLTSGGENLILGKFAGRYLSDNSTAVTSLNNSVYLGSTAYPSAATGITNEIVIGYSAIGNGSNSATLGNDSITKTILKGNVGIGTAAPTHPLSVEGSGAVVNVGGTANGTSYLQFNGGRAMVGHYTNGIRDRIIFQSTTGRGVSFTVNNPTFASETNEAMTINTFGNVGIGNTAPRNNLEIGAFPAGITGTGLAPLGIQVDANGSGFTIANSATEYTRFVSGGALKGMLGTGSVVFAIKNGGDIQFSPANTDVMRLTSSGNVGIGTTTPTSKLSLGSGQIEVPVGSVSAPSYSFSGKLSTGLFADASNNIQMANSGVNNFSFNNSGNFILNSAGGGIIIGNSGSAAIPAYRFLSAADAGMFRAADGTSNIGFSTAGVNRLHILANGNIGIGTTTPSSKLTVVGDIDFTGALKLSGSAGTLGYVLQTTGTGVQWVATSTLGISTDLNALSTIRVGSGNTGGGSGAINFGYSNYAQGNYSTSLGYDNESSSQYSVAVGYLNIASTNSYAVAVGGNNTSSGDGSVAMGRGNEATALGSVALGRNVTNSTANSLMIGVSNTAKLTIDSSGNVGISGTASTGSNLLVGGSIIYMNNQQALTQGLNTLVLGAATYFTTINYGNASTLKHNFIAGNVGIGTTTPSAQLTTTGTVRFASLTGAGSNLIVDSLGNVTVSSDERLKNIDSTFNRGLEDIMKINPITYHWKTETGYDTTNAYTGFSAQNIQLAIPEAVATSSDGFLNLADRPIIAALVNAVKELSQKISSLYDGVAEIFVKKVKTSELCLDDVCITSAELREILNRNNVLPTQTSEVSNPPPANNENQNSTDTETETNTASSTNTTSSADDSQAESTTESAEPAENTQAVEVVEPETVDNNVATPEATASVTEAQSDVVVAPEI